MNKSLKLKMIVIFSSLILISGVVTSFISFQTSKNVITSSLGDQALSITENAVKVIDLDQYEEISLDSGETDYYYELKESLNEIRETNGLVYLYTMGRQEKNGEFEYFYMVDGMLQDASALGDVEEGVDDYPLLVEAFETGKSQVGELTYSEEYGALVSAYIPIKSDSGELIGILGADLDASLVYSSLQASKIKLMWMTVGIVLLSILLISIATVSLVNPLKHLAQKVELVGKGDLTVTIESNRKDEIGSLTASFNHMLQELKTMIGVINQSSVTMSGTTSQLLVSANETKETSNEISVIMDQMASQVDTQYKSLDDSAKIIEEVSESVNDIAVNSSVVTELSSKTQDEIEVGNQKVNGLVEQMNTISRSVNESSSSIMALQAHSKDIESIVEIIQGIASQTNLLALNAAIEAARAGEAGKGFAVVADEVRKLAEQSEISTVNIRNIIEKINSDTNITAENMKIVLDDVKEGIHSVGETGMVFKNILGAIQEVNVKIQEVTATSEEMSAATEEITASAKETANIAEQASTEVRKTVDITLEQERLVLHMTESIEELVTMSSKMKELTGKFKL
ncbi:methyl-accepting chemotaxis protein [Robertmurraya beringensis]|uniref:Methyl-accepting chemotaxis protein n=1 Tax=Robertmurraya beringensis TaxID=641660 RepID=A0ABV6KXV9_9BACI